MSNPIPALAPGYGEDDLSQIPALHLLQAMGYRYLSPARALEMRGGRRANVFLDSVLESQLKRLNQIRFKGRDWEFSEANIQSAIQTLKSVPFDGLVRTNALLTEFLLLGRSLPQTIEGDTKSFSLRYIDWNPATWLTNNLFHVVEEFEVERTGSKRTMRPDLVLFVNGIPLGVIECKQPGLLKDPLAEAISQNIRNQRDDGIPQLFFPAQLVMALSKNDGSYATVGTPAKFWSQWREDADAAIQPLLAQPLDATAKAEMFSHRSREKLARFSELERMGREVTGQDRALYCLARPARLLELTREFTLLDGGAKKIARYQQFFCVQKIMARIRRRDEGGARRGGVVWHTQGSGKSLTMVLLAKAIALEPTLRDAKIVLVTDRVDLDDQLYGTFKNCEAEPVKADNGAELAHYLRDPNARLITAVINKFETAAAKMRVRLDSPDIFVLVDESHRGQYGPLHGRMRQALPNACFIGFTGTPVKAKDRDTVDTFGGLIDAYTIRQAVEDKAVVPLLYEGRDIEQNIERKKTDREFDLITAKLSEAQKADLKKKFATTDQLNQAEQKIREIALDISLHWRDSWQGKDGGFKAQLVAPSKRAALLYKKHLDEWDMVSSEVLISGPDEREGFEETDADDDDLPLIVGFWRKMMARHGSEEAYNRNLINAFKTGDAPEIIIVVDKLLTGFDAPRNTVLYLTRQLKDHTLLQAIARVNRLHEGKDFGYIIDYRGVLQNLSKAFDLYGQLEGYEAGDIAGSVNDVASEIAKLPQLHADVWDEFKTLGQSADEEAFQLYLEDQARRDEFYERLLKFGKALGIALSSSRWMGETPEPQIKRYRDDLRRFMKLRTAVRRRYAEVVDFAEYEPRIQKLLDTHVGTGEVETVTSLVNIFDQEAFQQELDRLESAASRADTIAHRAKRTISERMSEDPTFYARFSSMIEQAILDFRNHRLSEQEYLAKVEPIAQHIRNRTGDEVPESLRHEDGARAFYGILLEALGPHLAAMAPAVAAQLALGVDAMFAREVIVGWARNEDAQNRMRTEIEDLLFEVKTGRDIELSFEEMDGVIERCLDVARARYGR